MINANIHNAAMKEFVNQIADLSPATIRDYVNIAKSVVPSARDAEGRMLFRREWDDDFIHALEIDDQDSNPGLLVANEESLKPRRVATIS